MLNKRGLSLARPALLQSGFQYVKPLFVEKQQLIASVAVKVSGQEHIPVVRRNIAMCRLSAVRVERHNPALAGDRLVRDINVLLPTSFQVRQHHRRFRAKSSAIGPGPANAPVAPIER